MRTSGEHPQHRARLDRASRFAQGAAFTFDDRVGCQDDLIGSGRGNRERLLARHPEREVGGGFVLARGLDDLALDDPEAQARVAEQLMASRRTGGENESSDCLRAGHGYD